MAHYKTTSTDSATQTAMPDRADVTVYTSDVQCPCCGQLMEARKGQDQTQTNARGESRVIKAYALLTCKNKACGIYYQTFDERGVNEIDLSLYIKAVAK